MLNWNGVHFVGPDLAPDCFSSYKRDIQKLLQLTFSFYLMDANTNHQCQPQIYTLAAAEDIHLSSVTKK